MIIELNAKEWIFQLCILHSEHAGKFLFFKQKTKKSVIMPINEVYAQFLLDTSITLRKPYYKICIFYYFLWFLVGIFTISTTTFVQWADMKSSIL